MGAGDRAVRRVFVFGLGYTGRVIAHRLLAAGDAVAGTTRSAEKAAHLAGEGLETHIFTGDAPMDAAGLAALAAATHLVVSVQPGGGGDAVLAAHGKDIATADAPLRRIAYLSTTAVYGDHGGAWIDEETTVAPASARARARVAAEEAWRRLADARGIPLDIFRLSGIYGPGRNQILGLRAGKARRIVRPGQVFNRIHVDDIATTVLAAFERDLPGAVYNLADDEPAPPEEVVAHAAALAGIEPPPLEDFATAGMTPMARSFYSETRRIRNDRIKQRLGVSLRWPTYREGLAGLAGDAP
jgi:nucleoside-diphosphate-sugar epimerase